MLKETTLKKQKTKLLSFFELMNYDISRRAIGVCKTKKQQ